MHTLCRWRQAITYCSPIGKHLEWQSFGNSCTYPYEHSSHVCRCSVQRIARRSGVLSTRHYELLSAVNFDWTGADALS